MLFLKRCSDVFEAAVRGDRAAEGRRDAPGRGEEAGEPPELLRGLLLRPAEEARWSQLRDEVHKNVGDGLNKALAALEHENTSLAGVLGHIDFTGR
jgi:type I restriction enzyme M protein